MNCLGDIIIIEVFRHYNTYLRWWSSIILHLSAKFGLMGWKF
uniref:Uncharacterized protein n=1 Tax=Rhizophora mucronata TaxID=61149 RepID=A0A2P2NNA4_RHIMU